MSTETTPGKRLFSAHTFLFLGFIILLSYLTYFHRYYEPPRVFWDENYHIASAQKYLHGVYFMEQHPPLGKLLIALGEKILQPNAVTDQFIDTDYATNFGDDFSFAGYRLFSALLSWWAAPLIFLIFLFITRNSLFASLLSFLYVFDNALIVHQRGAMLEGPLMFFCVLMILAFFLILEWRNRSRLFALASILFGASFALILTTKVLGLIMILLVPAVLYLLLPDWRKVSQCLALFLGSFIILYVSVWQTHFALGSRIVPKLPDQGFYQASTEYKEIIATGRQASLVSFPIMLRDSLRYVTFYNRGAPRIDLCKPDENGSTFFMWPLGARSINYRWETPDGTSYRYLYLQSNPVIWLGSFAAVLLSLAILVSSFFFPSERPIANKYLLSVFVGLYISYMIAISRIDRVLYLYHYFIPLLFAFIISGILFMSLERIGRFTLTENRKTIGLLIFCGLTFVSYQFYRPLSYYEPLTDEQFKSRAILPVWELSCVHCERVNSLAVPRPEPSE